MQTNGWVSGNNMKVFLTRILFCFLLLTVTQPENYTYAQQKDTLTNNKPVEMDADDEEFNVFLFMFALAVLSLMTGCLIAGIIIVVSCVLLLLALVSFGIISVSLLTGYYRRSVSAGFKAFVMLSSCVAGTLAGFLGFTLIVKLFKLNVSDQQMLITGSVSGAVGGLLLGWVAYKIIRIGLKWGLTKFNSL
jgi:hypothetical protein